MLPRQQGGLPTGGSRCPSHQPNGVGSHRWVEGAALLLFQLPSESVSGSRTPRAAHLEGHHPNPSKPSQDWWHPHGVQRSLEEPWRLLSPVLSESPQTEGSFLLQLCVFSMLLRVPASPRTNAAHPLLGESCQRCPPSGLPSNCTPVHCDSITSSASARSSSRSTAQTSWLRGLVIARYKADCEWYLMLLKEIFTHARVCTRSCAQFNPPLHHFSSHWSLTQSGDNADFFYKGAFFIYCLKSQANAGPRRGSITQASGSSIKS